LLRIRLFINDRPCGSQGKTKKTRTVPSREITGGNRKLLIPQLKLGARRG
jgi:hypothetical protein